MGPITSNLGTATTAASKLNKVSVEKPGTVSLSKSNIPAMVEGAEIADQLVITISSLVDCTREQADKFPQIAKVFDLRDKQLESSMW